MKEIAAGIIDGLKGQPYMLAAVIMNLALLALLYIVLVEANKARTAMVAQVFETQKQITALIKCDAR